MNVPYCKVKLMEVAPLAKDRVKPFTGDSLYLATGGLQGSRIEEVVPITYDDRPSRADLKVRSGDVIWARMAATHKVLEVTGEHSQLIVSTGFAVHRPKRDRIHSRFLYHLLSSPPVQRQKDDLSTGATQVAITNSNLRKLEVPLPPLEDQHRIAAILDRAEAARAKQRRALARLDDFLAAVFDEMFGDPVTNSKDFSLSRIGDVAQVATGATPSRKRAAVYFGGDIPWVKTGEVRGVITYTEETITDQALSDTNCKLFPPGTVLVAMYGQGKTRGRAALLSIEAATNQACAAILPSDALQPEFLHFQLGLLYERLRSLGRGGNQANLNLGMIKRLLRITVGG